MNPVLPIWRSYAGLMDLSVQSVMLSQSRGIKLGGDWFAPDVAIKHQPCEVRSSIKHAHLLQRGLRLLGRVVKKLMQLPDGSISTARLIVLDNGSRRHCAPWVW